MKITICIGSSCHLKGSRPIIEQLQKLVAEHNLCDQIELSGTFCTGNCQKGVCVYLDDELFSLTPDTAASFFNVEVLPRVEKLAAK